MQQSLNPWITSPATADGAERQRRNACAAGGRDQCAAAGNG